MKNQGDTVAGPGVGPTQNKRIRRRGCGLDALWGHETGI